MNTHRRYPPELKERAVKMVLDQSAEYHSEWQVITSIAGKFGMTTETLRKWVRQAERDRGLRLGFTTSGARAPQGIGAREPRTSKSQ